MREVIHVGMLMLFRQGFMACSFKTFSNYGTIVTFMPFDYMCARNFGFGHDCSAELRVQNILTCNCYFTAMYFAHVLSKCEVQFQIKF